VNTSQEFQEILRWPTSSARSAALDGPDRTVGYADFEQNVQALSTELAERGVTSGSRVALRLPPTCTYLYALFAVWRLGATVVVIDYRAPQAELRRCLELTAPSFVVDAAVGAGTMMTREAVDLNIAQCADELVGRHAEHGLIQFSSGSTGQPKIIGRTFESLCEEARRIATIADFTRAEDGVLLLNSLTHSFGMLVGVLNTLRRGARIVLARSPLPADLRATFERRRVSIVLGVPFHFELLAQLPPGCDLSGVRLAISGGERLPTAVAGAAAKRLGVAIGQAYGTTETGLIAFAARGTEDSVGQILPGICAEQRDEELYVRLDRSPYLSEGGAQRYAAGWLRTYDRVSLDEATRELRVKGRADSLVIAGGLKIDLKEIEEELCRAPGVRESLVIGSEIIEAFVAADERVRGQDLLEWCRERLADYKIPRRVHVLSSLPRTPTGKLLRERAALISALDVQLSSAPHPKVEAS